MIREEQKVLVNDFHHRDSMKFLWNFDRVVIDENVDVNDRHKLRIAEAKTKKKNKIRDGGSFFLLHVYFVLKIDNFIFIFDHITSFKRFNISIESCLGISLSF